MECFITVYKPIAGWKAQLLVVNDDGFFEPWNTSYFAYPTKEEAIAYGKEWAEAEGIEFKL